MFCVYNFTSQDGSWVGDSTSQNSSRVPFLVFPTILVQFSVLLSSSFNFFFFCLFALTLQFWSLACLTSKCPQLFKGSNLISLSAVTHWSATPSGNSPYLRLTHLYFSLAQFQNKQSSCCFFSFLLFYFFSFFWEVKWTFSVWWFTDHGRVLCQKPTLRI